MEKSIVGWLFLLSVASFALAVGLAAMIHDVARIVIWALGIGSIGLLVAALALVAAARLSRSRTSLQSSPTRRS
ncbi:MAG: hypothetical protein J0J06_05180 [Sphingomonas sp.]|uniref:hypothetical protein n=1 Tax=Sphingomonas sp. TaxID=28214 RepID=UPI001ACF27A4|nr:hypothetical protein [Sphingomonas sp.]MBN8814825.1 hypothetical protein [Sphingomonas sp.]